MFVIGETAASRFALAAFTLAAEIDLNEKSNVVCGGLIASNSLTPLLSNGNMGSPFEDDFTTLLRCVDRLSTLLNGFARSFVVKVFITPPTPPLVTELPPTVCNAFRFFLLLAL